MLCLSGVIVQYVVSRSYIHCREGRGLFVYFLYADAVSMGGAETLVAVAGMVSQKAQDGDFNSQCV
jgi:hypothetical protein